MAWIGLKMGWIGLNWIGNGLNWIELDWKWIGNGLKWVELDWKWLELNWIGNGLNWTVNGLNWIRNGLNWTVNGLNWIGYRLELDWIFEGRKVGRSSFDVSSSSSDGGDAQREGFSEGDWRLHSSETSSSQPQNHSSYNHAAPPTIQPSTNQLPAAGHPGPWH